MRMMRRRLGFLLLAGGAAVLLASCSGTEGGRGAEPAAPAEQALDRSGAIVFSRGRSIYAVNPDGSGRTVIVTGEGGFGAFDPEWSPDRRKMVFALSTGGTLNYDIYVVKDRKR